MQEKPSNSTVFRIYSIFFVTAFFCASLIQLDVPKLSLQSISENFLWRQGLIENFNSARFLIGDRVFSSMLVGRDGWLFFTGEKSVESYQKTLLLSQKDLREALKGLALLNKHVAQNGGRLIVVIAPDKHTIYPQYMPEEIPVIGQISRMDMLLKFMRENKINVEVVDLRPALIKAGASEQLYYKDDTHWNCLGAYYAYQEVVSKISTTHPDVVPHPLTDFNIQKTGATVRDIPIMMGFQSKENGWVLTPKFKQSEIEVTQKLTANKAEIQITKNPNPDLPTAIIAHDSFYAACFDTLFERHFSRTVSFQIQTINKNEYLRLIEQEKPDIVIFEFVERFADAALNFFKAYQKSQ
jgi:hypothetical protein